MTLREFLDSLGESIKQMTFRVRKNGKVVGYFRNGRMMVPDILGNAKYVSFDFEKVELDGSSQKIFCITIE